MTSIDKMSIRGIRSFSPNETQVIEFFKPLTLIVGKNGSGKTTTIECLKMGTTGDLPPNCRSGQAFINDPNVFNSSEVKAQIKLKFTTATGKPAVCTRSFSLVQKPQRKEYKAFEAALQTIDENGDKTSLSYKSADLNKLVPEMMHVSTAVLDSVIFVHQEDSCWPLAEDKVLKQRFDDIFAATNYTKALDAIKAYRLDKSKDIKVLAAELETLETKLTQANRLRTELQQSQVDKDSLVEQIDKAKDAVQKGRDRLPALRAEKEKGEAARAAYERAANEHNHAMQAAEESNQSLERTFGGPLEETDEELREIETAQQSARIKMMADMDSIKGQAASMEAEIEQAERARDSATGMLEQQRAQEAHHKKVEEEAQTAATEMEQRYLSKGDSAGRQPTQTPIAYVQEVAEALARVLSNRQSELRDSKEERQRLTQTKGAEVQQLRIKLEHSAEQASAKEREASALQAKARQLEERLETGAQAGQEATLTRVRQEVKDLKGQLSAADEDLRGSTLRDDLASSKHRKRTVKDKLQALAEELVGIEREGDKQQRLQRHKEVVAEKRAKLESAIGERRPRLHGLIDVPLADDVLRMLEQNTLVSSLSRKKNQREEEASEKEGEVQAALDKAQKKSYDVHAKQEQLRELQCKHNEEEERVRQADPAMLQEHYDGSVKLHQLEEALVEKQEALTGEEGLLTTMIKAKDRALSHGKCLVCAQTVGDDQKNKIDDKIKRIQAMLAAGPQKKDEVTEAEEKLAKHKRMAELGEVVKKRRLNELPAMEQMFEQAKSEHAALKRELEGAQRAAAEQKQLAVGARDLLRDVDHLRYLHKEWQEALGEVASIQSGMQSGMHAVYRPRDAVVAEQDESNAELERLEKAIEKDDAGLRRKESELSELRTRSSAKELECNKLAADVERRKDAEAQLAEVRSQMGGLQQTARHMCEQSGPQQQELSIKEGELKAAEERLDADVKRGDAKVGECVKDQAKLTDYRTRLRDGASSSRRQLMSDCESRVETAQQAVKEKREALKKSQQKASVINEKLQGQEKLRMQMMANLENRKLVGKERALHEQAVRLRDDMQAVGPAAQTAEREMNKIMRDNQIEEMERSKLEGSLSTVLTTIKGYETQLADKIYRKIDQEHREKLIEHKTVQMAVDDLNRYYKALNAALMRFHETKMADVNKAVTELWNKTYKGTDIDGIAIKTEDEGQTADGRRKQSYRVVMKKGDTTLDMRGRCSAGQKVLASLVIRLALAESFCVSCGILALDEPTTNLDRANVESLAAALNEIIKSRKHQAHFQLIIITHDEEFVQLIGRSENASHYFYIEKKFGAAGAPPASTITKLGIERFG